MASKHHGSGEFHHHDEQPQENGHERERDHGACHDRVSERLGSEMSAPSQYHHEHGHHEHGHHDHPHSHREHGHHEHGHHEHGHHEHGHHDHPHSHHEHGHHDHAHSHQEHSRGGGANAHAGFRREDAFGAWRANREPGFGRGKVLFFDAFSGVAGDMIVAALIDLGVPQDVVERAIQSLHMSGCSLHFQHGYVGSIGALKFDVEVGAGQTERDYATIDRMLQGAELDPAVSSTARTIFRRLAEAEASVHRTAIDAVHFHEVGAVDSIADIVGAAACIEYIGASVWCSPLPMGRGFIQCRHGKIPLPAPATVQCLAGISTCDAGIEAELVTPTGAAILGALTERCVTWPEFIPSAVGWGAGTRVLPDRPNVLRVVLGEPTAEHYSHDEAAGHVVIEANVDDATGELAGHALGLLLDEGALDAWAVPITMKKGRPGVVLSAIVAPGDEARLTALLIRETTTLGVRRHVAGRTVRPRRMIDVSTQYGTIPVKVSEGPFGPPQIKPEFDVCVQRARELNLPVREVLACAASGARRVLELDGPMDPSEHPR